MTPPDDPAVERGSRSDCLSREVYQSCTKKVKHANQHKALHALALLRRALGPRHKLEAYPCRFCDGWHLGHVTTEPVPPAG
jgi:hypothetical protein